MGLTPEQMEEEIGYLNETLAMIRELIQAEGGFVDKKMDEIQDMKKYLWENSAMLDDAEIASGMYDVNCRHWLRRLGH